MSQLSTTETLPAIEPVKSIHRFHFSPPLTVAVAVAAIGARFLFVIRKYSINILFFDQWDYLDLFFNHEATPSKLFFLQHGPHREGIGLIADEILYPLTHWSVRAESFLIASCIFAAMLVALVIKRKLFGSLSYSDVAIPLIFLTLAQFETLIGTPNPAYSGFPLLMIMLYCLCLLQRNFLLKCGAVLVLNFLLIYTGFGLFMGIVTIGVFALECYRSVRRFSLAPLWLSFGGLVIALASLGSFFVDYTWSPAVDCESPKDRLWVYPWFVAIMFSRFIALTKNVCLVTIVGAVLLGAALVLATVHILRLLKRNSWTERHLLGAVLLSYSAMFCFGTSLGRICLGLPGAAQVSRYMTLLIPAFLAFYFYLLSIRWRRKNSLMLLFVLLLIPGGWRKDPGVNWVGNGKRNWMNCYLRTEDIDYCDRTANFVIYPHEREAATHLKDKLEFLKRNRLNLYADMR